MNASELLAKASDKFALNETAKEGIWISLLGPNQQDIGIGILVVSETLKKVRKVRDRLATEMSRKSRAWQEKNKMPKLCDFAAESLVVDWWFWDVDEQEAPDFENDEKLPEQPPYSAEAFSAYLKEQPTFGENTSLTQIDVASSDPTNFAPSPDLGKSASTSPPV